VRQFLLRLWRGELPEGVGNVVMLFFGTILATAVTRMVGGERPDWLDTSSYYCAVIGIIVSTILAALSYFAAPFIRKGTSFLSFGFWFLLCGGFFYAVLLLSARSFALGCAVGVLMLFFLFAYCHASGMWKFVPKGSASFEAGGFELAIRALAVLLVILSTVSIVVLFAFSIFGAAASLTIKVGTGLHAGPFLLWSVLASVIGSGERA